MREGQRKRRIYLGFPARYIGQYGSMRYDIKGSAVVTPMGLNYAARYGLGGGQTHM